MSVFFLHPIYLYGLVAASIPVLIHLLNRRRFKRMRFPAVRFIALSQRRISRSHRLRHWIVLALRTAAILFLVLLLAQPIFQVGAGLYAGSGPLSLVAILDNSLSMKWAAGGEGWNRVTQAVRRLVSSLKPQDRLAIIATDRKEGGEIRSGNEKEILFRELQSIRLADGTADFARALREAYEILAREPGAQKEIWLITDMALTGWDRFSLAALGNYDPLIPLKVIKVGEGRAGLNATVKEVKAREEGVAAGVPLHLEASVVNWSDKEIRDLLVELSVDGKKRDQRLVSLRPAGESRVTFELELEEPGSHRGEITLEKPGLAGNRSAYFALEARDRMQVLIVDGDPKTALAESESFFLVRALNPSGRIRSTPFLPTVILPERLGSLALDPYEVLILCNVSTLPEALLPKLRDFVLKGRGILLFLGDRVQIQDYNLKLFQSSPPVLASRILERRVLRDGPEKIARIDAGHPALQKFADSLLKQSLQSAEIRAYFRAEAPDRSALLTLAGGDPLLLERRIGPGRVLLFTTAADQDWSNLPLKTAYLPLVQSVVAYLSGPHPGVMDPGIEVGHPKVFSFPPSYAGRRLRIIKPDGQEREIAFRAQNEKALATFEENDRAGIYRFQEGRETPRFYAVNAPALESRLEPILEKELRAKLDPVRVEIIPLESLEDGGKRFDLSLPLAILILTTLLLEARLAGGAHE